jgi:hypothetical protein
MKLSDCAVVAVTASTRGHGMDHSGAVKSAELEGSRRREASVAPRVVCVVAKQDAGERQTTVPLVARSTSGAASAPGYKQKAEMAHSTVAGTPGFSRRSGSPRARHRGSAPEEQRNPRLRLPALLLCRNPEVLGATKGDDLNAIYFCPRGPELPQTAVRGQHLRSPSLSPVPGMNTSTASIGSTRDQRRSPSGGRRRVAEQQRDVDEPGKRRHAQTADEQQRARQPPSVDARRFGNSLCDTTGVSALVISVVVITVAAHRVCARLARRRSSMVIR